MDNYNKVIETLTENPELTIFEIHEKTFLGPKDIFNILESSRYGSLFKSFRTGKGLVYSKS